MSIYKRTLLALIWPGLMMPLLWLLIVAMIALFTCSPPAIQVWAVALMFGCAGGVFASLEAREQLEKLWRDD